MLTFCSFADSEGINWPYWFRAVAPADTVSALGEGELAGQTWYTGSKDKEAEFGWGFWLTLVGAAANLFTVCAAMLEAGVIRSVTGTAYDPSAENNNPAKVAVSTPESTV
jgi:hypothetical protein